MIYYAGTEMRNLFKERLIPYFARMNFDLNAAFSLSIAIGAVIALVRIRRIEDRYAPFLVLTWTGLLNEIASIVLVSRGYSNAATYNLYTLAESLLILWQFKRWGLFQRVPRFYTFLLLLLPLSWCCESIVYRTLFQFNSYFIIFYSFLIVMGAIYTLSEMLFYEGPALWRQPPFLICMGFVIYFTYSTLTEVFWVFGLAHSKTFRVRIYEVLAYINLLVNLIYATALLWMPTKLRSIPLS